MKLSFEIYTAHVIACRNFYCNLFGFTVKFETEGFVILRHAINDVYELMFCVPNSPFVHAIFHTEYSGVGALLQMEVDDVMKEYHRLVKSGVAILLPPVMEPVNGYHFTLRDPSGLLIDIVQFN